MNEQTTIALFIDFELILYVAIEKFEHFDDRNYETIFVENIWFRDVAKKLDETNETNRFSVVDFFLILHVNSDVVIRKSEFLIDFRTWCWRMCSWNLLLKLKFCLQCLQIRAQTICRIENFFIDFDAESSAHNWKLNHFDESDSVSCKKNEQMSIDLFSNSHVVLIVLMRFKISCSLMCSKSFLLKSKFCLHCLHFARMCATIWIDEFFIVFDIITNVFNERFKRDAFNLENK